MSSPSHVICWQRVIEETRLLYGRTFNFYWNGIYAALSKGKIVTLVLIVTIIVSIDVWAKGRGRAEVNVLILNHHEQGRYGNRLLLARSNDA